MFIIIRNNNGATETLKDSSSQSVKTFADYSAAKVLVKQLNQNVIPSKHWTVSETTISSNMRLATLRSGSFANNVAISQDDCDIDC